MGGSVCVRKQAMSATDLKYTFDNTTEPKDTHSTVVVVLFERH